MQEIGETVPSPSSLNLHTGTSGRVFDSLLKSYARNGGAECCKRELDNGDGISASLKSGKNITAGLLMKYGVLNLNNKDLIQCVNEREKERLDAEDALKHCCCKELKS